VALGIRNKLQEIRSQAYYKSVLDWYLSKLAVEIFTQWLSQNKVSYTHGEVVVRISTKDKQVMIHMMILRPQIQ
jgi:hypothetical protein